VGVRGPLLAAQARCGAGSARDDLHAANDGGELCRTGEPPVRVIGAAQARSPRDGLPVRGTGEYGCPPDR